MTEERIQTILAIAKQHGLDVYDQVHSTMQRGGHIGRNAIDEQRIRQLERYLRAALVSDVRHGADIRRVTESNKPDPEPFL